MTTYPALCVHHSSCLVGEADDTMKSVMVKRIGIMRNHVEAFTEAVRKAIAANHAMGLPVYQCKDGYIIAIYPDGREVKLQKAVTSEDL